MKKWYTNGEISKFCEECPEGYREGRGKKKLNDAEQQNQDTFDRIINSVPAKEFNEYYKTHSKVETKIYYDIKSDRALLKILNYFNYDFSFRKSKKGKSCGRSHANYVAAGQKSAATQKQHWAEKSNEEKQAWSTMQKEAHNTNHFKEAISKINIDYWANMSEDEFNTVIKNKLSKEYETKTKNNSFNISKPEDRYYEYLLTKYSKDDIVRQYRDEARYPYNCDFYIKSKDLFIELNFTWTHGGHIFDVTNENDIKKLNTWRDKAKKSDYYKMAIYTWTELDTEKQIIAKENNINYLVFYTEDEAYNYGF